MTAIDVHQQVEETQEVKLSIPFPKQQHPSYPKPVPMDLKGQTTCSPTRETFHCFLFTISLLNI